MGWPRDESLITAAAATLVGEYPQLAGRWLTLAERQAKHVAIGPNAERYQDAEMIDDNLFQAGKARRSVEQGVIAAANRAAPTGTLGMPSGLKAFVERAFARLQELVDAIIDRALGRDGPTNQVVEAPALETSPPKRTKQVVEAPALETSPPGNAPGTPSVAKPPAVRGKGRPTGGGPPPRAACTGRNPGRS